MRVLVAYASRYGATQGIAERIAATLRQRGLEVAAMPVQQAADPASYDAVVMGSATYFFHWMRPATSFVHRHTSALASHALWIFSSGPLGASAKDPQGRDLREVLVPKEIARLTPALKPRDHRVFFGAMDSTGLGFLHKLIYRLPANGDNAMFPQGDFRNWADIDTWATMIADSLKVH
jgi:menaquinone-dependent protoporphyrinogen oxidase